MKARLTERGAALAAKQLHYHRHRLVWIVNRIHENEDLLISYLEYEAVDEATFPGGYRVTIENDGCSQQLSVAKRDPEHLLKQLVLRIEEREIA